MIRIRPLIIDDAKSSFHWRNDKEVFKFTGNTYSNYISYETELEWIKRVIETPNEYRCAIEVDNVYVGNIYLTDITEESAKYHIFIGEKKYWGKGVAKEASKLILEYAFKTIKLKNVYLKVRYDNTRAIILYKKIGFKKISHCDEWINMVISATNFEIIPKPV